MKNWIKALAWAAGFWVLLILVGALTFDKVLMPLVVGKHKEMLPVPNVVGLMPEEAHKVLKKSGFGVTTATEQRNSTLPSGMVMLQIPAAGLSVKEGRVVQIVLSKGVQEVLLPQLKGSTLTQAQTTLSQLGLNRVIINEVTDAAVPDGIIVETVPAGGASVGVQTQIQVMVAKGGGSGITMPDLTGRTKDEAQAMAQELGMQAAFVEDPNAVGEPGRVVDQSPVPGAPSIRGQVVQMVVVP